MQAGKKLRTAVRPRGRCSPEAIGAAGCAESDRGDDSSGEAKTGGRLHLRRCWCVPNFDPIFNDDGESLRPVAQMYDTLIQHKPGTADLVGGLAESWEHDPDGKVWTFKLRQGVKFHDGCPLQLRRGLLQLRPLIPLKSTPPRRR